MQLPAQGHIPLLLFIWLPFLSSTSLAYDPTDRLSIESTLTAVGQHAELDNVIDGGGHSVSDTGRAAVVLDIGLNYHPTTADEFQLTLGFAEGDALNRTGAFSLAPFADDLEADLEDINYSGRDHLLEAWYKHTFDISETTSLGISAGIIGATAHIDDNAYANDEISQFMNDIFVNNTLANLPDYDTGAALEFEWDAWTLSAVVVGSENDDRNDYKYYALQVGHHTGTSWGPGYYRLYAYTTDDDFMDRNGTGMDSLSGFGISIDQQISAAAGLFARLGIQDDAVPVDHDKMVSLGINVAGTAWNRPQDVAAAGIAFLDGAHVMSSDIDNTVALETYYRHVYSEHLDLTLDAQWIAEDLRTSSNTGGFITGIRLNASF